MLTKRAAVTSFERATAARNALELLVKSPLFMASQHIACYFAQESEFDCTPFINAIWAEKKSCYLPVLVAEENNSLTFSAYHPDDFLSFNRYKILEPENKIPFPSEELDLVFLPLVGFDLQGNRLGMGGGYYDRTFAFLNARPVRKPYLVGLAYECQCVSEIPQESWDVKLDAVLTEKQFVLLNTFRINNL